MGAASAPAEAAARTAIRKVCRVQRGGGRSSATARHAERPSPNPSRRAGGEHNGAPPGHGFCIALLGMNLVPSSHFVPFRSVFPAAGLPWRRDPDSRVSCAGARARRRAYRGGAVRAPDCACAPARASRTRDAPRPSAPRGLSRAGARRSGFRIAVPFHPPQSGGRPPGCQV